MSIKPITPAEVGVQQAKVIPSFVIEVFNRLIAAKWHNGYARIRQDEVVDALVNVMIPTTGGNGETIEDAETLAVDEIFDKEYLNVEEAYRAAGWKVTYDTAFNESYPATYIFSRP